MIRWFAFRDRSTGQVLVCMATKYGYYPISLRDATDEIVNAVIDCLPDALPVIHCSVKRWEVSNVAI